MYWICVLGFSGDFLKSQKTVSIDLSPITEYNPLSLFPIHNKSIQEVDILLKVVAPVHSNLPRVYLPVEVGSKVRPKLRRVTGKRFLLLMVPVSIYSKKKVNNFR